MKTKKWNFLVYIHGSLLLWAMLFVASLFISDGGKTAGTLAVGNALFLFVNIPFAVFTLTLKAKNVFDKDYECPAVVLSIVNIIVGLIAWFFAILLMLKP